MHGLPKKALLTPTKNHTSTIVVSGRTEEKPIEVIIEKIDGHSPSRKVVLRIDNKHLQVVEGTKAGESYLEIIEGKKTTGSLRNVISQDEKTGDLLALWEERW